MSGLEELREVCQLKAMLESADVAMEPLGPWDRIYLGGVRFLEALERRWKSFFGETPAKSAATRATAASAVDQRKRGTPFSPKGELREGDWVEIRPWEEIRATLVDGKTRGLDFMPRMGKYCGRKARVLKRVRYMFDERAWMMRRCNSVLLEDVICDGRGMYDKDGCDRCCYFFWKEEWLRRLGPNGEAMPEP